MECPSCNKEYEADIDSGLCPECREKLNSKPIKVVVFSHGVKSNGRKNNSSEVR